MQFLRTNTAVIVTVGPFFDKTDGVTIETALTITNERITLTADTDAGSAPTIILDNITGATAATANDLNYITNGDNGMMQIELAAADVNRVGRMVLTVTDAANHVPVWHEFFVLPQAIYDWLTGVIVPLPANVTQLLGSAVPTPTVPGIPNVNVKTFNDLTAVALPLVPTTAGRTLDVSATGEAGVDWANVGAPTTTLNLSGTTIKTATDVETDTAVIGALGAGLTALATQASVDAVKIDTAAILVDTGTTLQAELDAIEADVDAILVDTSEIGAAGAGLTAINLPNQTMDIVGNITGNLSGSVGSVTAGVTLAASAVQAIWDALTSALTTVGSIGKRLVDDITGDIYARLGAPAGASVSADLAAVKVDTAAILVDTGTTLQAELDAIEADVDAVLADTNELQTDWADGGRLDLILDAASAPSAAVVADAVWDELLSGHAGVGSTGAALSAAGGSGDPWSTAIPGSYGAGTAGKILGDNVNATISSRSSHSAADVWASGTRTLTSFGTLVADVWAAGTRTLTSFGTLAADVWAVATRLLTAGTNIVLAKGVGLTGLNDLSAAQVNTEADTAIVDAALATAANLALAKADTAAIKLQTDNLPSDPADESLVIAATDAIMSRLGVAGAGLTAVPWNATWDAEVQSEVQDALDGTIADSIPADGTRPSMSQALYMVTQFLLERSVSGTTVTVKKADGSSTLLTLTLGDATSPTSITRAA